jgi:hypothetical protein
MKTPFDQVNAEVMDAYADAHMGYGKGMDLRNLNFKASHPVTPLEAFFIFNKWCPNYNGFGCEVIKLLPEDSKVTIAREGSVCIYVSRAKLTARMASKMKADEFTNENGTYRLWWD